MGEFYITRFDKKIENLEILEEYMVNETIHVTITKDGRYIIKEPTLTKHAEELYNTIMKKLRNSTDIGNTHSDTILSDLKIQIEKEARELKQLDLYLKEKQSIEYYLKRDLDGYGIIDPLIQDDRNEDILGVRWDVPLAVKHRDYPFFHNMETNVVFSSKEMMSRLINRIASKYGEPPTEASPSSSFTARNNVRFTVTGNDVITPNGSTFSIRIPSKNPITICDLLENNILTPLAASYLWLIMDLKGFGLIIGATASGKTTMINALLTMANPQWHYYTIEDVLELRLNHKYTSQHKVATNSTLYSQKGQFAHGVFDLLKLAMRFKPEFVLVGEVLGDEAKELFQVAQSGSGCISSFHASNPYDALSKLQSSNFNVSREQTRAITYILHMSHVTRKNIMQRAILEIVEPVTISSQDYKKKIKTIFHYDEKTGKLAPDSIDELLSTSTKLQNATTVLGITNIKEDIQKRIDILEKIQNNKITNPNNISKEISKYYLNC